MSHEGTCAMFSFVRKQTVFQVMQFNLSQTPTDGMSGISCLEHCGNFSDENARKVTVSLSLGGPMRFSCRCSGLAHKLHKVSWDGAKMAWKMETEALQDARFYLKLYNQGKPVDLSYAAMDCKTANSTASAPAPAPASAPVLSPWETRCKKRRERFKHHRLTHGIEVMGNKTTTIMAAFKLESGSSPTITGIPLLSNDEVSNLAGVSSDSVCEQLHVDVFAIIRAAHRSKRQTDALLSSRD